MATLMSSSDPRVDRSARAAVQLDQPEVLPAAPTPEEQAAAERVLARYPEFRRDQLPSSRPSPTAGY
jgi:hypothetical protein